MSLYSIPPLLSIVCFLALAFLTLLKGGRTPINRLFSIICLLATFIYGNALFCSITPSARSALIASRLEHLFIPLLLPLYLSFFQGYLNTGKGKAIVRICFCYVSVLICLAPTLLYIPRMAKTPFGFVATAGPLYFLFPLGEVACTLYILTMVYRGLRREEDSYRKNRLKYVLVGFGSLGLLNGFNFLTIYGVNLYPPGNFSFIPLTVFAVGLFKHDLLDMGLLVKKSLIYSVLTALLTCLYALLIVGANRLFSRFISPGSLLIPIGFFFLIAFIFGPMKHTIQRLVDHLFGKSTYHYRATLRELGRRIVSELDADAIAQKIISAIETAMNVRRCDLLIRKGTTYDAHGHDTSLDASQLKDLTSSLKGTLRPLSLNDVPGLNSSPADAGWAFPLLFQNRLNGILVLGEKRSGHMFTREDFDLLETVCSQSALALENARSYQKIRRLNSQLEKKVADRTRKLSDALREKEKTQEQLIRSESLAAIGQLVAGVAHELNNPLASAMSLIQSTLEDLREEGRHQEMVDDLAFVDKELIRAKNIVRSLLGLSRQTDTFQEQVDMNAVVRDAYQVLQNQYRHSPLDIQLSFDEKLPGIPGNFATLGQVALNILQNAIQAVLVHDGGRVALSTRYHQPDRKVVFECTDTGPGIPPAIQKDIFKPFFTTKDVGQGTGLGLYISHEIIRKHGGSLTFKSEAGRGTCFQVQLPVGEVG
jgi:two-component system NtrC family sensor kinase